MFEILQADDSSENELHLRVGSDSKLDLGDRSVDLVTSCQAAHWFDDLAAFYAEADRVLRPGGAIAVYGYHFTDPVARGSQEEQERVERFLDHRLGAYRNVCRFSLGNGWSLKAPRLSAGEYSSK